MAEREPARRPLLHETVLRRETPARIVGAALVRRLGSGRPRDAALRTLVCETLGEDPALLQLVEADLVAVTTLDPACRSGLHALLHLKGFQALQCHRVAHSLWTRGRSDAAHWISSQTSVALGVDIHPAVPIGRGVMLDHGTGIVIGETAVVDEEA